jgi:hypothetical protein
MHFFFFFLVFLNTNFPPQIFQGHYQPSERNTSPLEHLRAGMDKSRPGQTQFVKKISHTKRG